MELREFGADDLDDVRTYVEVQNVVRATDSPWEHPLTVREAQGGIAHGWDGDPETPFLAVVDGQVVGTAEYGTSRWDNFHIAWMGVAVHPAQRRRGYGTQMLEMLFERARADGRTTVEMPAWEIPEARAFAARHGFECAMVAVNRRQFPAELDRAALDRLYDEALPHASAYELVRRAGRAEEADLTALAEMAASINDAPIDDLDVEDEVFTAERMRSYEDAQEARGHRLYRVFARHRESGEWAGQSAVAVESERPHLAAQHDTSVVRAHRGHRLGLLLKLEMLRWLAEDEPQVREIDTWNAESNDHMIEVNEVLGYRVMSRGLEFQRKVDAEPSPVGAAAETVAG
jgi:GNAT superfamily N-acetyltransferase